MTLTSILQKVLDEIDSAKMKPSIISFNILIHAYCEREQGERALALLKRAQTNGIEPDVATYDIIAQGLLKKKQTAAAAEVLTQMIGKRMSPSRPAMYTLIRQFTDTMKLKEAEDWLDENRRLGFAPTLQQIAHLLLQYTIHDNDDKAAEWQRRLMESKYTPEEKDRALRWCKKHMARSRAKQHHEIDEPAKPAPTAEQELQSLLDSH